MRVWLPGFVSDPMVSGAFRSCDCYEVHIIKGVPHSLPKMISVPLSNFFLCKFLFFFNAKHNLTDCVRVTK